MKLKAVLRGRPAGRLGRSLGAWLRRRSRGRALQQTSFTGLEPLEPRVLMAAQVIDTIPDLTITGPYNQDLVALNTIFDDAAVQGTVAKFESVLGTFYVELFDAVTPLTVQNFLNYVAADAYNDEQAGDTFVHRSMPGFVVQGGGFRVGPSGLSSVPTSAPVANEFQNLRDHYGADAPINVRGTIAMAKQPSDPNSATSQWFFNLANNSSNLDGQNGGFTTFGQVLYGGMSVVDAIAAVQVWNGSSLNPALTNLPLINYSEPLRIEHFVRFTEIGVAPELTYSIANSRPDLVNVAVVNGQLRATSNGQRAGIATVMVTATDRGGNTAQTSFDVRIFAKSATYTDAAGAAVTMALRGDGVFTVEPAADPALGALITMQQTSERSMLTINSRGGAGQTPIHQISADGSVRGIVGRTSILTGDIIIGGSAAMLTLHSVTGPSTILIGAGPAASSMLSIGVIADLTINSQTPLKSLRAGSWTDAGTDDQITAPRIDAMMVRGDFDASLTLTGDAAPFALRNARVTGAVSGDATWQVTGAIGAIALGAAPEGWELITASGLNTLRVVGDFGGSLFAASIRSANIGGDMIGAVIALSQEYQPGAPALRSLMVRGIVDGANITAAADVGRFTTAAFRNSSLRVGLAEGLSTLPTAPEHFASGAAIAAFTLRGARDGEPDFANSQVAASTLRQARLGVVSLNNGGEQFGLSAQNLMRWFWNENGVNINIRTPDQLSALTFDEDFIARLV